MGTDEVVFRYETAFFEVDGRPSFRREVSSVDREGDGAIDRVLETTYDDLERIVGQRIDDDNNGVFETQVTNVLYDDANRFVSLEQRWTTDEEFWFFGDLYWVYETDNRPWVREYGYTIDVTPFDSPDQVVQTVDAIEKTLYFCN